MDTMSEVEDLPISPLVTINKLPVPEFTVATATHITARTRTGTTCKQVKQKKVTSDDVLRLQYETLQCKKDPHF